jgi:hypothetical protein
MKRLLIAALSGFILLSAFTCNKNQSTDHVYRGKLVRKGLCMNYTISVVSGSIDTAKVQSSWTDPQTNTTFQNAFRLESVCDFPTNLQEGDEFSFVIDNNAPTDCAVCLAFYPTPRKGLKIRVVNTNR